MLHHLVTIAPITLYTWWRSQASFRVRIALNLKELKSETVFIDLSRDDQLAATYRSISREMVLPTLKTAKVRHWGSPLRSSSISRRRTRRHRSYQEMHMRERMCAHSRKWWPWMRIHLSYREYESISSGNSASTSRQE